MVAGETGQVVVPSTTHTRWVAKKRLYGARSEVVKEIGRIHLRQTFVYRKPVSAGGCVVAWPSLETGVVDALDELHPELLRERSPSACAQGASVCDRRACWDARKSGRRAYAFWYLRCWERAECVLCGLTFELRWDRQQNARPAMRIIACAASRAWCFDVGPRLERGVRLQFRL